MLNSKIVFFIWRQVAASMRIALTHAVTCLYEKYIFHNITLRWDRQSERIKTDH